MKKGFANVAQVSEFDEVIDARSPAEFLEDRIPGAISCPVLDNEQRVIVGTIYKQQSAFEARKIGGAMVADNIARHLREKFADKPRDWRPLVYCWRGGQRSGSFVTWLRLVGWDACQLEGGYKAWRHKVMEDLEQLPKTLRLRVLCGATGSGKTRILEALAKQGAQIIDLEALAVHKGSVLGGLPGQEQPTQKAFDTLLHECLGKLDASRPVYLEAESRRIGRIHLPDAMLKPMRAAECIEISASHDARIAFLVRDYDYLGDDINELVSRIDYLRGLQSNEVLSRWKQLARNRDLKTLFTSFIDLHYDPLYRRSQNRNFIQFSRAVRYETDDLSPEAVTALARRIISEAGA